MIFVPQPLRELITDVPHPLAVKNMAGRLEGFRYHGMWAKIEQRRKGKPHPAPFISNRSPTLIATDLTRQYTLPDVPVTMVKTQQICSDRESYLMFMKDSRPLHRGTMQSLAGLAVTELRIHGISAHFVANSTTKARRPIFGNKCRIVKGRVCSAKLVVT